MIPKQTVQIIAQGIGISHLGEDVAAALAPDAEYRMREIIQVSVDTWPHLQRNALLHSDNPSVRPPFEKCTDSKYHIHVAIYR